MGPRWSRPPAPSLIDETSIALIAARIGRRGGRQIPSHAQLAAVTPHSPRSVMAMGGWVLVVIAGLVAGSVCVARAQVATPAAASACRFEVVGAGKVAK